MTSHSATEFAKYDGVLGLWKGSLEGLLAVLKKRAIHGLFQQEARLISSAYKSKEGLGDSPKYGGIERQPLGLGL